VASCLMSNAQGLTPGGLAQVYGCFSGAKGKAAQRFVTTALECIDRNPVPIRI
jgi:hypothetical protein